MKKTYYFFSATTFKDGQYQSDEDAISAATIVLPECVRVMRASDSDDIWKAEPAATETPAQ
jgi:hypothetical protein